MDTTNKAIIDGCVHYWSDEMFEEFVEYEKTIGNDMEKIAFKPHKTRGREIIKILENMGGVNKFNLDGSQGILANETNYGNYITNDWDAFGLMKGGYKIYTLEEYEEEEKKETIVDYVKESNDRYRIVIDNRFDVEVDEGEYYAVRRKNEYPKTYEECVKVLGYDDRETYCICHTCANERLLESLYSLKVCRDAYWKIAGEEMGLGKSWEPDWKNSEERRYCIVNIEGDINLPEKILTKWILKVTNKILVFPTEEMRDDFYKNFKNEIEKCKEFL